MHGFRSTLLEGEEVKTVAQEGSATVPEACHRVFGLNFSAFILPFKCIFLTGHLVVEGACVTKSLAWINRGQKTCASSALHSDLIIDRDATTKNIGCGDTRAQLQNNRPRDPDSESSVTNCVTGMGNTLPNLLANLLPIFGPKHLTCLHDMNSILKFLLTAM